MHTASTFQGAVGVFHRCARWFDANWTSGHGGGSKRSSRRSAKRAVRRRTIATSSKRSCGGAGRESRGGIYRVSSGLGKPSSIGSTAGRRRVSGVGCSTRCRAIPTTNGTASTAQSTALTSTPQEERGGRRAGHRSFARRSLHQGPRRRRRARIAPHVRDHRGPTARPAKFSTIDVEARVSWSARWPRPRGNRSMTSFANTRKFSAVAYTSRRS